jgi:hypothetical protein
LRDREREGEREGEREKEHKKHYSQKIPPAFPPRDINNSVPREARCYLTAGEGERVRGGGERRG